MKCIKRVGCSLVVLVLLSVPFSVLAAVNPAARLVLDKGVELYEKGELKEASDKFVQAVEIDPDAAEAYYYLGLIHIQANQAAKGLGLLEQAYRIDPEIPGLRTRLASLYLKIGKPELALPLLGEAYAADPEDAELGVQYGKQLVEQGSFEEGEQVFRGLLAQNAQADAAAFYLGVIRTGQQFYATAERYFLRIDPQSPYGDAAQKYLEALEPATRPLKLMAAAEYFYNDNPEADSVTMVPGLVFGQDIQGSQGHTLIGTVSTPNYDFAETWQGRIGYMYYGNFYRQDFAKDNDYEGHFVTPVIGYRFGDRDRVDFEGRFSTNDFNEQDLSDVYRLTARYTRVYRNKFSFFVAAGWQGEVYTDSYRSSPSDPLESLEYKDTNNLLAEAGGRLLGKDGYGSLSWKAGYLESLTVSQDDPLLEVKADDYRHRDFTFSANLTIPGYGVLEPLTFKGIYDVKYRDYLNTQSGQLYSSAIGKDIDEVSVSFSGELHCQLYTPAGLTVVAGAQHKTNESAADELVYNQNRYYLKLSASY